LADNEFDHRDSTGDVKNAYNALYAGFGGWMMDGFDFMIFSLALTMIIKAFHLSLGQAGLLATASLFISAFGGLLAGTMADYWGRARTLAANILLYAIFTGLTGLAFGYGQLFIYRALEGLGFGGTWAAGAALVSETAPAEKRGRWIGWMQSSWAVGWGLALIVYLLLSASNPGPQSWRILFFVGTIPALFVFFVLKKVKEPPIWLETMKLKKELRERKREGKMTEADKKDKEALMLTFFQLWAPDLIGRTILGLVLSSGALLGYYAIFTFLPAFLEKVRHLTAVGSGVYLALVVVGSFAGYLTSGWLNDRLGRRINFLFFSIGSAVVIVLYSSVVHSNALLIPLSLPLGFFASGIFSGFGSYLAELFPSRARGAAQGFIYNGGRAVASLGPALIGYLASSVGGLGNAIAIFGPLAYVLCVIAVLLLPETKGIQLKPLE